MANIIKCNTATLSTDRNDVDRNIKQIKTSLATLRGISARLDGMWDGDASVAYKAKLDQYIKELDILCTSLNSIVNYEDKAVTEYNKCEKDISGIISSISV